MTPLTHPLPKEPLDEVIWRGHQDYSTLVKYYIVAFIMVATLLYLTFWFSYLFLFLLIFPFALLAIKLIQTNKTIFEINTKRIVMKQFQNNKYLTYEVELYDIKHIVQEEKANGTGYIHFKTASSLFPQIKTPLLDNPTYIHNVVRDAIEKAKIQHTTSLDEKKFK